jgi:microcystin-dependent protein
MTYTTNYKLHKPDTTDSFSISDWNINSDIIDTTLATLNTNVTNIKNITDSTFKNKLLNFCYPVGSIYWSGNSTNPGTLFGGIWTQIEDTFLWAKGAMDTLDATGGAKTVTLTTTEMPSHTHTFTGSAVTSGDSSAANTGSESSHTHSYSHTHGYTPAGKIASTSGGTDNKTAGMSANSKGSVTKVLFSTDVTRSGSITLSDDTTWVRGYTGSTTNWKVATLNIGIAHTHTAYFTGTDGTTISQSKTTTGEGSSHSHTMAHTHSVTASGTNANTGGGGAHNNMPPYIVKYCWQRTA